MKADDMDPVFAAAVEEHLLDRVARRAQPVSSTPFHGGSRAPGWQPGHRRVLLVTAAVGALVVVTSAASIGVAAHHLQVASPASTPTPAVTLLTDPTLTQAAAESRALAADAPLPPGTAARAPSSTETKERHAPAVCYPVAAQRDYYTVSDHSPMAVEAFLRQHPPAGLHVSSTGTEAHEPGTTALLLRLVSPLQDASVDYEIRPDGADTLLTMTVNVVPGNAVCLTAGGTPE